MSNISSIIHIHPGQVADKAFLSEALTKFPTVLGFAIQHEGELITESHKTSMKYDDLDVIIGENTKPGHRVLLVGNWSSFENLEDVGPYVLEDRNGQPIAAIFMEGDFSDYADAKDKHVDEFNAWYDEIGGKVEKLYVDAGEDDAKFVEALKDAKFQKLTQKAYSHRGQFVILTKSGEPVCFGKDDLCATYSWGWASNVHGMNYTEKAPEPEKPAVQEKVSVLDRLRGKTSSAAPPPPAPDVKNVAPAAPKTETKSIQQPDAGAVSNVKLVMMQCPPKLKGGAKNHWLRLFNAKEPGELPQDHQSNKVQIPVAENMVEFAKRDVESTKDMRKLTDEVKQFLSKGSGPAKPTTLDTGKSTVREPAKNYTGMSGVLDVKQKEKAMGAIADYLGLKKTPLEIQKTEATSPSFSSEIGMTFEELLFVGADGFAKAIDGDTKIAVAIITEMKQQLIQRSGIKLEDLVAGSKGDEPKEADVKAPAETKPAASVAPASDGLSFLRRPAA